MNYDDILRELETSLKNIFIFGLGGSGKTHLIKKYLFNRNDVIVTAPSGIAAQNIGGKTIQSFFSIPYYTYLYDENTMNIIEERKEIIKNASTLLIDEVFLLRCEIIDIVDKKLRKIRNCDLPFGGLRLILIGDPYQLEPVVPKCDINNLREVYPENNDDYFFYNSNVFRNSNLLSSFSLYELTYDFRHENDQVFQNILNELRNGSLSDHSLNTLNSQTAKTFKLDERYQYLSVTKASSVRTNNLFLGRLDGFEYVSEPVVKTYYPQNDRIIESMKISNNIRIPLKLGMKVVFVKNDSYSNGNRWYNGTIGYIKNINGSRQTKKAASVFIEINGKMYEVFPETDDISYPESPYFKTNIGTITQFPFIPAFSITIDKSQGMTLDKIYLMLDSPLRNNQLYVALSRARSLKDIILSREIRGDDIKVSSNAQCFYSSVKDRLIPILYEKEAKIINNITCNFNVNIGENIIRSIA
jgi:ATP-dependent exoDNAse (exonuclease V) alpha subunit